MSSWGKPSPNPVNTPRFLYGTSYRDSQDSDNQVTAEERGLATFKQFVAENPHTGTTEQIVNLSMGIAAAADSLSSTTLSTYRDATALGEKVFSKLKVIGDQLGKLDDKTRREATKELPASFPPFICFVL